MTTLIDIRAPEDTEGTKSALRAWLKQVGDAVRADEPLAELETDKVAVEVSAPAAGVLAEILVREGDVAPGQLLARLAPQGAPAMEATPAAASLQHAPATPLATPAASPTRAIGAFDPALRLSPAVRRLCADHALDPRGIPGTGRDGRLTASDVEAHLKAPQPAPPASAEGLTRIPHSPMRRRIAEHMAQSVATAPHVTALFEADFSAIIAHRNAHKAEAQRLGFPLTFTAYFVMAAAQAMAAAPAVNSRWHEDHLELFRDVNIGVGAALGDKGLIVPVIHRAQTLSLFGIAEKLADLTERARTGKLAKADVQGGTFSISNHGVSGTLAAYPIIINQPQSAILGVGKLEKRVVVRQLDGQDAMLIRPMAYVTLTIDHRVLDGAQTNAWLTRFVEALEGWG